MCYTGLVSEGNPPPNFFAMKSHQPFGTVGEEGYLHLLSHILNTGYESDKERTGTGTIASHTPHQLHFPRVAEQFPLFTTKYVSFNMLACEMLWFISGSTHIDELKKQGSPAMANMWSKWDDDCGSLGPVYGKQWREWESFRYDGSGYEMEKVHIDQLRKTIDGIKENPESRRHIVTAWNPADIDDMALPPCHLMYQFTCEPIPEEELARKHLTMSEVVDVDQEWDSIREQVQALGKPIYRLHLHMTQRSCDLFLGAPFNIAEYALLLMMVAEVTNTAVGGFTWTGVNCHIYKNHIDAVEEQLSRQIAPCPQVKINGPEDPSIDDFKREHIELHNYYHNPKIEAEVSV